MRLVVEVPDESVRRLCDQGDYRFWDADELGRQMPLAQLSNALDNISEVPDLAETVMHVVGRIHLLEPNDSAFDINFSYPDLPFSVFVSIPRAPVERASWRIAEALIHEACHLQLSLIEKCIPLVSHSEVFVYSPWRKTPRPVGGVLHGLYVFGVIAEWMAQSSAPAVYVKNRLAEVTTDATQLVDFPKASGLTDVGAALASDILVRIGRVANSDIASDVSLTHDMGLQ